MTELRKARIMHASKSKAKKQKFFSWGSKGLKYTVLAVWFIVCIFPFVWALMASFSEPAKIATMGLNPFHGGLTANNYHVLFTNSFTQAHMSKWISNGIIFSVGVATLNVFFNFLSGYGLSRIAFKGRNSILWYLIVGMMVPAQITQVPQLFILIKMGFISPTGSNFVWFLGIIFASMTSASWIFLIRQHYVNMGTSAEEAGSIDGLSTFGVFFKISLKVMIPLMATMWAMIFMASWNNFIMFTLWSSGDPDRMTLVAALSSAGGWIRDDKALSTAITLAATNIAAIPVLIVYIGSLYFQKKGVAVTDK